MSVQKSPKYSTFRIAQGPSPDGVWKQRRKLVEDVAKNWRSEMTEKIEKKLAEKTSSKNDLSNLFHDAVSAVKKAADTASEILATMRIFTESLREPMPPFESLLEPLPPLPPYESLLEPLPPLPPFESLLKPLPVVAPLIPDEIFTAEEIAVELKWIDPLVSFPE